MSTAVVDHVLRHSRADPDVLLILLVIAHHADDGGGASLSEDQIAEEANRVGPELLPLLARRHDPSARRQVVALLDKAQS